MGLHLGLPGPYNGLPVRFWSGSGEKGVVAVSEHIDGPQTMNCTMSREQLGAIVIEQAS